MRLDSRQRTLHFDDVEAVFSRQEWDVLVILVAHPNRFLTTQEVLRLGWRAGAFGSEEVRIYMRRLRAKMEPLGLACELVSRHGHRYCLKFAA